MKELNIPAAAKEDKHSFEILRVWSANQEQYATSLNHELSGNAYDFGYMLGQLAIQGAKLYSDTSNQDYKAMLEEIIKGFDHQVNDNTGKPMGPISLK